MDLFTQYPHTLLGLFIFVIVAMVVLFGWVIRTVVNGKQKAADTQSAAIGDVLTKITEHMAKTNMALDELLMTARQSGPYWAITAKALEQIQGRLLDAVLIPATSMKSATVTIRPETPDTPLSDP